MALLCDGAGQVARPVPGLELILKVLLLAHTKPISGLPMSGLLSGLSSACRLGM